jgi:flagellum-specific ATP synthase
LALAQKIREVLAIYADAEDLINIGAYVKGSNPKIDWALSKIDAVNEFLRQGIYERASMEETIDWMERIVGEEVPVSEA